MAKDCSNESIGSMLVAAAAAAVVVVLVVVLDLIGYVLG